MKRILVTGGSRGLGLAVCARLLAEGCAVVTAARRCSPGLTALRGRHPGRLEFHAVDFAEPGAVARLARAARLLEGVDGFVANAGLGLGGLLTLTREAALRECVEVNLVATMLLTREVIKGMLARGGSLVFVSSAAARSGVAGLSVYSATKGALLAFSRTLAREYGPRGIRSNCVLPGFLDTEMSASLTPAERRRLLRRTPAGRLGRAEDVVGAISFLLSEEARHITGAETVIDGGMLA